MRDRLFMKLPGQLLRITLLGSALGLLAGCVAPYAYVQPDVVGGGSYYTGTGSYPGAGYYTSNESYTGAGYYDEYGTGPYYPGTNGWGYYNGSFPYGGGFGYFGGYGNWPVFFNIGFSSVWDFPGYWGPWYTTILPFWSDCRHRRCGEHRHHHQHWHGHRNTDAAVASRAWLHADHPSTSHRALRTRLYRPGTDLAGRHPVHIAAFAHDRFVHAPVGRTIQPSFRRVPARSRYNPQPADAAWGNARDRFVHAPAGRTTRPDFRDAPMRPMDGARPSGFRAAPRVVRMQEHVTPQRFRPMPSAAYAPATRARSRPSVRVIAPRARHSSRTKIP